MRLSVIILAIALTGCTTFDAGQTKNDDRIGLSPRKVTPGDCGLFVWKADKAKTFILYADKKSAALYRKGAEVELGFGENTNKPNERLFVDQNGQTLALSLFESEAIEQGTRYKAGRLSAQDINGWETVTPVVGLFTCQPVI